MSKLPNILIVDDYESYLQYLEMSLNEIPAHIISSGSGTEALTKIEDMDLALAILDVQMHPMSGLELARQIHERQSDHKTPIIFLTSSYPDTNVAIQGYKAGAIDYIYKPVDHHILMSKVKIFMEMHQQRQSDIEKTLKLEASEAELKLAKQQLEKLNFHIVNAIEEERANISLKVHDELGQTMTALKMDLSSIKLNSSEEQRPKIDRMMNLTNELIRKVQRISHEMHPVMLHNLGLIDSIEWYCRDFEERTGIICTLSMHEEDKIDPSVELALFRVLQEAMTNIIRHAKASEVKIKLFYIFDDIIMKISDNGIGMSEHNLNNTDSMGLLSMRQRIRNCKGNIEFSNLKKGGLSIMIQVPDARIVSESLIYTESNQA